MAKHELTVSRIPCYHVRMVTKRRKSGKRVSSASNKPAGHTRKTRSFVVKEDTSTKEAAPRDVTFGSVTIKAFGSTQAEVERNISAGQSALGRAKMAIIKPGVKIDVAKGVPLFHADPERPDHILRVINGKREHGVFVGGKFKKKNGR